MAQVVMCDHGKHLFASNQKTTHTGKWFTKTLVTDENKLVRVVYAAFEVRPEEVDVERGGKSLDICPECASEIMLSDAAQPETAVSLTSLS